MMGSGLISPSGHRRQQCHDGAGTPLVLWVKWNLGLIGLLSQPKTRAATASNFLLPSKYGSSKQRTKWAKPDIKWTEADDQNLHKNARGLKICLMQLMRLYLLLFPLQWSRGIDHINNYGAVSIIGKLPCSIMTWRMRGSSLALATFKWGFVWCQYLSSSTFII